MPKSIGDNELELFLRHTAGCDERSRGRRWRCSNGCPIWCDGKLRGRRYRRSLGTDWARAQRKVEQLLKRPDAPVEALEGVTLEQAQAKFSADCESRNCSEATVFNYNRCILTLRKFAEPGLVNVDEITDAVIDRLRRWMAPPKFSPATTKLTLTNLKTFFAFCKKEGWLEQNPLATKPKIHVETPPAHPLSNDEVRRVIDACGMLPAFTVAQLEPVRSRGRSRGDRPKFIYCRERALAFLSVMLYTGMRISDATLLRRDSVDLETGRLLITPRKTRRKGKVLSLQLQPEVVRALKDLPAEEGTQEHFFLRNRTTKLAHVIECNRDMLRKVFRLAQVEGYTPHNLRDTFAKAFLMAGGGMRNLQLALGHSSITITEKHYAGFDPDYQRGVDAGVARISFER